MMWNIFWPLKGVGVKEVSAALTTPLSILGVTIVDETERLGKPLLKRARISTFVRTTL